MIAALYDLATTDSPTVIGSLVVYEDGACIMRRWDTEDVQLYEDQDSFAVANKGVITLRGGRSKAELDAALVQDTIRKVCAEMADFLVEKNVAYGNSVLDPLRIFSKASPLEGARIRIDDKLNRLLRGTHYRGDDDVKDLVGYLVLHLVGQRLGLG